MTTLTTPRTTATEAWDTIRTTCDDLPELFIVLRTLHHERDLDDETVAEVRTLARRHIGLTDDAMQKLAAFATTSRIEGTRQRWTAPCGVDPDSMPGRVLHAAADVLTHGLNNAEQCTWCSAFADMNNVQIGKNPRSEMVADQINLTTATAIALIDTSIVTGDMRPPAEGPLGDILPNMVERHFLALDSYVSHADDYYIFQWPGMMA